MDVCISIRFLTQVTISSKSIFPSDILKWMKLNAKPRMALKLMQVCKYFQHKKFPYFVIKNLHGNIDVWEYQPLLNNSYERIDFESLPSNLWILGSLNLMMKAESISFLMSKILICDIRTIHFIDQNITFDDFKKLTDGGKIEYISLNKTFINYDDEEKKEVPLENLFDCLPNVKGFAISFIANSFVSFKIATIKVSSKLKEFRTSQIRRDFKVEECIKFILNNQQIYFILDIGYSWPTNKLEALVDEVIKTWSPEFRPPYIAFDGETNKKLDKFANDWCNHYLK